MTKTQFRWVLAILCAAEVCCVVASSYTKPLIPETVRQAERAASLDVLAGYSLSLKRAMLVTLTCITVVAFVGLIGTFFFWRPGLYLYLCALVIVTLMTAMLWPWGARTRWQQLSHSVTGVMQGVIFAFAFFGPAKHLFQKK